MPNTTSKRVKPELDVNGKPFPKGYFEIPHGVKGVLVLVGDDGRPQAIRSKGRDGIEVVSDLLVAARAQAMQVSLKIAEKAGFEPVKDGELEPSTMRDLIRELASAILNEPPAEAKMKAAIALNAIGEPPAVANTSPVSPNTIG